MFPHDELAMVTEDDQLAISHEEVSSSLAENDYLHAERLQILSRREP
jgi:hypothetical protein